MVANIQKHWEKQRFLGVEGGWLNDKRRLKIVQILTISKDLAYILDIRMKSNSKDLLDLYARIKKSSWHVLYLYSSSLQIQVLSV